MLLRPRAAFVVTVSVFAATGCKKEGIGDFECKPPDCHMNPPPPPPPPTIPTTTASAGPSGSATAATPPASSTKK